MTILEPLVKECIPLSDKIYKLQDDDEQVVEVLQKYHNKPLEKEAKSIVAGPSFLQYLNKLFQIKISAGDQTQMNHKRNEVNMVEDCFRITGW